MQPKQILILITLVILAIYSDEEKKSARATLMIAEIFENCGAKF